MLIKREPSQLESHLPLVKLCKDMFCIVDPENLSCISHYDWRRIRSHSMYYACRRVVRNGHYHYIRMHREIVSCPSEMQVHHINGNTLDNRKCNLKIVTPQEHKWLRQGP